MRSLSNLSEHLASPWLVARGSHELPERFG
jgi:hypothetical protein